MLLRQNILSIQIRDWATVPLFLLLRGWTSAIFLSMPIPAAFPEVCIPCMFAHLLLMAGGPLRICDSLLQTTILHTSQLRLRHKILLQQNILLIQIRDLVMQRLSLLLRGQLSAIFHLTPTPAASAE